MPAYAYEALDAQGQARKGVLEADHERAARSLLRQQALVPLRVAPVRAKGQGLQTVVWQARVWNLTALTVWTRQLASLVRAGLPLERSLGALADEADTPARRDLMAQLRSEVNAGSALARAMAQHPREFDTAYRAVVAAGEQSGELGLVLERLADELHDRQTLRQKLWAAGLYPTIVSLVALVIVVFLLAYVVPQVAQVFGSQQRALPTLTRVMLTLSSWVQDFWAWALLFMVVFALVVRLLLRQPLLRARWDGAWLRLPLIGRLSQGYQSARFASTLALLCGAGVPILKALQTASDTLTNQAMRRDALEALTLVREGAPLANALAASPHIPRLLPLFARLGEQSGTLPEMLARAAAQLKEEVQRRALQLATILEPLLIVTMGVMVMLIVLSVMLPILELNQWVR